jgi:hypothetical protein
MAKSSFKKLASKGANEKPIKEKESVSILITTEKYVITGKLYLPIPSTVENPTNENLLFHVLNCGNKFIQHHNCTIQSRHEVEYSPEEIKCYNINLDIVHSCRIVKD